MEIATPNPILPDMEHLKDKDKEILVTQPHPHPNNPTARRLLHHPKTMAHLNNHLPKTMVLHNNHLPKTMEPHNNPTLLPSSPTMLPPAKDNNPMAPHKDNHHHPTALPQVIMELHNKHRAILRHNHLTMRQPHPPTMDPEDAHRLHPLIMELLPERAQTFLQPQVSLMEDKMEVDEMEGLVTDWLRNREVEVPEGMGRNKGVITTKGPYLGR